jgi:hypothetical protein
MVDINILCAAKECFKTFGENLNAMKAAIENGAQEAPTPMVSKSLTIFTTTCKMIENLTEMLLQSFFMIERFQGLLESNPFI